jgi:hypothetical protein
MKTLIIAILVAINFCFAWALHDSWKRNERLADIGGEQYKTTTHLNERIGTLKREKRDLRDMCERIMEDAGIIIFRPEGDNGTH